MKQKIKLTILFTLLLTTLFVFAADTTNWNSQETLKEINAKIFSSIKITTTETLLPSPVLGETSILLQEKYISAECINKILQENSSPATGTGEVWITSAKKYGIDPSVGISFFRKESTFGKNGYANTNKSIGNRKDTSGNFIKYNSWEESIEDWFSYMKRKYISAGNTTVEKIIPIYAPSTENNTSLYIKQLNEFIALYKEYENKSCS